MHTFYGYFSAAIFLILFSCSSPEKSSETTSNEQIAASLKINKGEKFFNQNCTSCHGKKADGPRVGPPAFNIKKHYLKDHPELKDFSNALVSFVQNPSEENAKLKKAVEKFGLMPKMNYDEKDLADVAAYLYQAEDLVAPGKHKKHSKAKNSPLKRGKSYALATKSVLGKNLIKAINTKGTAHALEFCNTRALSLTDSMSGIQEVAISRKSDFPRNPDNQADAEQLAYISAQKQRIKMQEPPEPKLTEKEDMITAYYPIMTNAMCLQCHGTPGEQISEEVLQKIEKYYPNDKAKGYDVNELRGIWVVNMPKEN